MNLQNYINGKRYGKEAHQLERDAMDDPFLQDAIDGYDQANDDASSHLKKMKNQIAKQTRNTSINYQHWSIAVGVVLIICLIIFVFLYDRDMAVNREDPFIRTVTNISVPNNVDNNVTETLNQESNLFVENEDSTIKQKQEFEENQIFNQSIFRRRIFENASYYPVLEDEIQVIISKYDPKDITPKIIFQPPSPAIGENAYNDYIEKNRDQLTDAACENQHGKVILLFKVNAQGRPVDITILRSLCKAADREAIRLLQTGPNWTVNNGTARLEVTF